jgi:hypothetical protein
MKTMVRCLDQVQEITTRGDGFGSVSCKFIFEPSEDERTINHITVNNEIMGFMKFHVSDVTLVSKTDHQIDIKIEGI